MPLPFIVSSASGAKSGSTGLKTAAIPDSGHAGRYDDHDGTDRNPPRLAKGSHLVVGELEGAEARHDVE
jgi:hypothetical protein